MVERPWLTWATLRLFDRDIGPTRVRVPSEMEAELEQDYKTDRWQSDSRSQAATGGETPLGYMLRVMRDSTADSARRDEMAKAAAPYIHAKLVATEVKEVLPDPNETVEDIRDDFLADLAEMGYLKVLDEHGNIIPPEAIRNTGAHAVIRNNVAPEPTRNNVAPEARSRGVGRRQ
jgi:hypothetical protein